MQVKFSVPTGATKRMELDTGLDFPFERVRQAYPIGQTIQFTTEDGAEQIELVVTGQEFHFREDWVLIKLALR